MCCGKGNGNALGIIRCPTLAGEPAFTSKVKIVGNWTASRDNFGNWTYCADLCNTCDEYGQSHQILNWEVELWEVTCAFYATCKQAVSSSGEGDVCNSARCCGGADNILMCDPVLFCFCGLLCQLLPLLFLVACSFLPLVAGTQRASPRMWRCLSRTLRALRVLKSVGMLGTRRSSPQCTPGNCLATRKGVIPWRQLRAVAIVRQPNTVPLHRMGTSLKDHFIFSTTFCVGQWTRTETRRGNAQRTPKDLSRLGIAARERQR